MPLATVTKRPPRAALGEPAAGDTRGFVAGLVAIGLLALLVRAGHLLALLSSPVGDTLVQDAAFYHREAMRLAGAIGSAGPSGPSFMNVGLPYALAAVYSVVGASVRAALLLQAVLGALTTVALGLAVRAWLGGRRVAWAAAAIYAVYAQAVFYDGLLLTPSLTNTCLALALLALALHSRDGAPALATGAGLAVGIACALRANNLLLVPPLFLVLLLVPSARRQRPEDAGRKHRAAALFLAGAAAVPLPIVLLNGAAHGEWVPVSANGGMNFWVGNNRDAQGVYYAAPFLPAANPDGEMRSYLAEARRRSGRPDLTISASSSFWMREGLRDIRESPGRWIRIEGRKLVLFWNAFEVNTNVGIGFLRRLSPVLAFLPVTFGVVAPFGVAGIVLLFLSRRLEPAWVSASLVLAPLVTVLLFFVSGEYRHPASLGLAIGAAVALDALWVAIERRTTARRNAWALAAGAAIVPMVLWSFPQLRLGCHPRYDYQNFVREMVADRPDGSRADRDAFDRARRLLDRAPDRDGDLVLLQTRLDLELAAAKDPGDADAARRAVEAATTLAARDLTAGIGEYTDAFLVQAASTLPERLAELARLESVKADPRLSRELSLHGANRWEEIEAMLRRDDAAGALAFVQEALRRVPHDVDLQAEMGRLLLMAGREVEGLGWLERSCNGWPQTPRCADYAARYYASRGRTAEAAEAAREAARRRATASQDASR